MNTRTALVAISRKGASLVQDLEGLEGTKDVFVNRRWFVAKEGHKPIDLPIKTTIQTIFSQYQNIILIMPVGAAVRLIAPHLRDKHSDPAVVCLDDSGNFSVSLLSGHLGGADQLTLRISNQIGSIPVITSASYIGRTIPVDLLGHEFGWTIDSSSAIVTKVSADVVNGEAVSLYQQSGETSWWPNNQSFPDNITRSATLCLLKDTPGDSALIISDEADVSGSPNQPLEEILSKSNIVIYRPQSLVIGMGCRKGVTFENLKELLVSSLRDLNLSPKSIRTIATADIKGGEPGLLALAEYYNVPLTTYNSAQLNAVFESGKYLISPSDSPQRLVGVGGVCEPSALLASGNTQLLMTKRKTDRATIAVARMLF
jgi:cobalt-precorrin 5A hydrolase